MVDVVKAPRGAWSMPMKVDLGGARRKEMPMKVGIGDLDPTPSSSFSTNAPAENDLEPFEDSSQVDISFMEEDEEEAEEAAYYPGLWGTQERWDESQVFWPPCHEEAWCASGPWGAHCPQDAWYPHGQLVHGHFVAAAAQLLASGMHPGCWAPRPRGAARARPARAQAAAAEPKAEPKAASRAAKERGRAAAERESVVMPGEATTIMMRNLPNKYTRDSLLELLAEEGFAGLYDLVYLPVDFNTQVGLGYAFVNLVSPAHAKRFAEHFDGFSGWTGVVGSQKVCRVSWSDAVQGVEAHVERYRNSPVMHSSVPDEYKPQLFKDGQPIPFPAPTGRVKAPRARRSGYLPS